MKHIAFATQDFPSPVSLDLFWPNLEALEIFPNLVWRYSNEPVWEGILDSLQKLPNLKDLKIAGHLPPNRMSCLKNLVSLALMGADPSPEDIKDVLQNNPNLRVLAW